MLQVLKASFTNCLKDHDKRACHAAKGFIVVAPEQAWEKVFSAFKFCPFKMVKGTLCFIIKCYNKPLRLGTETCTTSALGDFSLKVGWASALGHSTALLPLLLGTVSVFFLTERLKHKSCFGALFCWCCLGRMAIPWGVREWHLLCFGLKNFLHCLKPRIRGTLHD